MDEAMEVDGGGLEDPHGLGDGRPLHPWPLQGCKGRGQQKRAKLTEIRDVQGDPSGRFKPPVVIDFKGAF